MQGIRGETIIPPSIPPLIRGDLGGSQRAFDVIWRLAILALPWQTRWFVDAQLADWPWEQGRLSFYISWIPMLAVIILGLFLAKRRFSRQTSIAILLFLAALGVCTILSISGNIRPAAQWWLQVLLAAGFCATLWRTQVPLQKIIFWFVISLIPAALVGIYQFFVQSVWSSSLLGMAAQNPADLGVSVIQSGGLRFLRAYGIFPHPNIFGAYMALGSLLLPLSIYKGETKWGLGPLLLILEGLFSFSLFLSFSRSAWIGFVAALIIIAVLNLKNWRNLLSPLLICLIVFVISSFVFKDLVFARAGIEQSRTEQISSQTRLQSYQTALDIFHLRPWFGSGPNNELVVYAIANKIEKSPAPLEPPHSFWLMMLDDFGAIGSLLILTAISFVMITIYKMRKSLNPEAISAILGVSAFWFVLSIFDHFTWSLWPGQVLTILTAASVAIIISSRDLAV